MRAGKLRHKLIIETPTNVKGAMGGSEKTWSVFETVRGEMDFSASRQVVAAQQINSEVVGVATIRYLPGVTGAMRINHDGIYYDISEPYSTGGRKRDLIIPFTSGLNNG